jgi:hypothetical protein
MLFIGLVVGSPGGATTSAPAGELVESPVKFLYLGNSIRSGLACVITEYTTYESEPVTSVRARAFASHLSQVL